MIMKVKKMKPFFYPENWVRLIFNGWKNIELVYFQTIVVGTPNACMVLEIMKL